MRGIREREVNQFGKKQAMFIVLFPEIAPCQLVFPKFLEELSLTVPLIEIRHVHAITKDQNEDHNCRNRGKNKQSKPSPVEPVRNRWSRHSNNRPSSWSSRLFHQDRTEQLMGRWQVRSNRDNGGRSFRFVDQPSVRREILFQVRQTPLSKILVGAWIEKESIRHVDRCRRCSTLDFLSGRHLFFARIPVGPVKRKEKNVTRRRNALCVE